MARTLTDGFRVSNRAWRSGKDLAGAGLTTRMPNTKRLSFTHDEIGRRAQRRVAEGSHNRT